jgi:hypothetical protein
MLGEVHHLDDPERLGGIVVIGALYNHLPAAPAGKSGGGRIMKMLTKEDVGALGADQTLELMDLLSESLEENHIPGSQKSGMKWNPS